MNPGLKQMLYYSAGLFLMKGVSFLMLPVIASALNATEFGQLDLWLSLLNIGSILIGFGLIDALYKQWGDCRAEDQSALISTAFVQQTLIALVVAILCIPAALAIFYFFPNLSAPQLAMTIGTLFVSAFINIPLSWLRLQESAKSFFLLTSSKALLQAALTWWLLKNNWGVTGILLSGLITSTLLAVALVTLQHQQLRWRWQPATASALMRYGWPLMCSSTLLFLAAGAERWILAATVGLAELGQYALAMQLALVIAIACEPLTLWWFPKRFKMLHAEGGHSTTARIGELISHYCLWLVLALNLMTPWLITELLPAHYQPVTSILPWLALGMAFKQMSHVLNIGCYINEQPGIVFKINLLMAVVALVLFYGASANFGLQGVVLAFVALYAFRALVFVGVSQRRLRLPYRFNLLLMHCLMVLLIMTADLKTSTSLLLFVAQSLVFIVWLYSAACEQKRSRLTLQRLPETE